MADSEDAGSSQAAGENGAKSSPLPPPSATRESNSLRIGKNADAGTMFVTLRQALIAMSSGEANKFQKKGNSGANQKFLNFVVDCGFSTAGKDTDWVNTFKSLLFNDLAPAFTRLLGAAWARDEFKIAWAKEVSGSRCFHVRYSFKRIPNSD